MNELDEKVYEFVKSITASHYLGRTLDEIEKKFTWGRKHTDQEVWASLSRLSLAKRIKKSGSHRYKGYVVVDEPTRDRAPNE